MGLTEDCDADPFSITVEDRACKLEWLYPMDAKDNSGPLEVWINQESSSTKIEFKHSDKKIRPPTTNQDGFLEDEYEDKYVKEDKDKDKGVDVEEDKDKEEGVDVEEDKDKEKGMDVEEDKDKGVETDVDKDKDKNGFLHDPLNCTESCKSTEVASQDYNLICGVIGGSGIAIICIAIIYIFRSKICGYLPHQCACLHNQPKKEQDLERRSFLPMYGRRGTGSRAHGESVAGEDDMSFDTACSSQPPGLG